jgi:hypothetical protein
MILLIGDGIAPPAELVAALAEEPEPAIGTVPDDEEHEEFERIDGESRWAGVALVDAHMLGSTAAMLGDWDLQSTLLRRSVQEGALRVRASDAGGEPLLADTSADLEDFQRKLLVGSRGVRTDWVSRYLLPPIEEFATEHLMETALRPAWLVWTALGLTIAAAVCFTRGWLGAGLGLLLVSTPLDLIASRLASLRLKPLPARMLTRVALWPATGLALLALGWWEMRHLGGWGALVTAAAAAAFAEATRVEKAGILTSDLWLVSRSSAIVAAIPFALAGAWNSYLIALLVYAALSFFIVQHVRHQPGS